MALKISKLVITATAAIALTSGLSGCKTVRDKIPGMKSGAKAARTAQTSAPQLGVNAFLWRASLETLNFMPLSTVDPFGGVIISDWYANPKAPNERFKSTIYVLDTQLRADALKVSVFKQARGAQGWADAPIDADTARQIENSILTRARELYIASN
ncbi:MAG: DUF3576 domain-containing protein [Robiginitomaculum sp.]